MWDSHGGGASVQGVHLCGGGCICRLTLPDVFHIDIGEYFRRGASFDSFWYIDMGKYFNMGGICGFILTHKHGCMFKLAGYLLIHFDTLTWVYVLVWGVICWFTLTWVFMFYIPNIDMGVCFRCCFNILI